MHVPHHWKGFQFLRYFGFIFALLIFLINKNEFSPPKKLTQKTIHILTGFGDMVALQKDNALNSKPEYVVFALIFILFGLAIVAASLNLLVCI